MREIKFRGWDKWNKKMANVVEVKWIRNGDEIKKAIVQFDIDQDLNKAVMAKDLVLMQFTGLKDKNSVEIYEGDIVKFQDMWGEVYWWDLHAAFHIRANSDEGGEGSPSLFMYRNDLEVIGNIYESKGR